MNLNWSNRVIKYVLFVFNLLFVISGIIMIAVGVSVKSYYTQYDIFLNDSYFSLPNLLIATGSLIFFISFFGCCGAIKESWFMIFIFSILLSIIFILEFSAGIAGYVLRDKTSSYLSTELKRSMSDYQFNNKQNKTNSATIMWDTIQNEFECCGADGPKDWKGAINAKTTPAPPRSSAAETTSTIPATTAASTATITTTPTTADNTTATTRIKRAVAVELNPDDLPASCCKSKPGTTGVMNCTIQTNNPTATYYNKGCVDGFGDYLKDHAVTIGGAALAIAFIQLFGVIFACHLAKQLKHGFYST